MLCERFLAAVIGLHQSMVGQQFSPFMKHHACLVGTAKQDIQSTGLKARRKAAESNNSLSFKDHRSATVTSQNSHVKNRADRKLI